MLGAGEAHAETLTLNSTAAQACPACTTDEGGARVLNIFENVTSKARATFTPSYTGPTVGFDYAADAAALATDIAGTATGGATTATGAAAGAFAETAATSAGFSLSSALATAGPIGLLAAGNVVVWAKVGTELFGGTAPSDAAIDASLPPSGTPGHVTAARLVATPPDTCWSGTPGYAVPGGGCSWPSGLYLRFDVKYADGSTGTNLQSYDTFLDNVRCSGYLQPIPTGTLSDALSRSQSSCHNGSYLNTSQDGLRHVYYAPHLGSQTYAHPAGTLAGDPASPATYTPPAASPTRASIQTAVQNGLNANPDLAGALEYALDHGTALAPSDQPTTFQMPNCLGQLVGWCENSLTLAGSTATPTVDTATWLTADLSQPANAIIETTPAPDTLVDTDTALELLKNPDSMFMPALTPSLHEGGGDFPPGPPDDGEGRDECAQYLNWLDDMRAELETYAPTSMADVENFWQDHIPPGASNFDDALQVAEKCDPYFEQQGGVDWYRYLRRLAALGLLGTITFLSGDQVSPDVGPGGVVSSSPRPGVRRLPIATPNDALVLPDTGTVGANPDAKVDVVANPVQGVDPGTGSTFATDDAASSPSTGPAVATLNFTPLTNLNLDKFPFAVPGWVAGALGGWGGSGSCPTFHLPMPTMFVSSGHADIDMCTVQPMVDIVRPVVLIGSLLGLAWFFMGAAMGFGGSGGTEE